MGLQKGKAERVAEKTHALAHVGHIGPRTWTGRSKDEPHNQRRP